MMPGTPDPARDRGRVDDDQRLVYVMQLEPTPRLEYVSGPLHQLVGELRSHEQLLDPGNPQLMHRLQSLPHGAVETLVVQLPCAGQDAGVWTSHRVERLNDDPARVVVEVIDITDAVQRADRPITVHCDFHRAAVTAGFGVAILSPDGDWTACNEALQHFFGEADPAAGPVISERLLPEDRSVFSSAMNTLRSGERDAFSMTARFDTPAGVRTGQVTVTAVRRANGEVGSLAVQILDLDGPNTIDLDRDRRVIQARFDSLTRALGTGVVVLDANGDVTEVNQAAERHLGLPRSWWLDPQRHRHTPIELLAESGGPLRESELPGRIALARGVSVHDVVVGVRIPSQERRVWLLVNAEPVADPVSGRIVGSVTAFTDITGLQESHNMARHLAHHDLLTGLPNRLGILTTLDQALPRADRTGAKVGVLYIDVDGFKSINDRFGHDFGDRLLTAFGGRLTESLRRSDTVGRLHGDEFVVILQDCDDREAVERVADTVASGLQPPLHIDGIDVAVVSSVGAVLAEQGESPEQVLRRADQEMYRVKRTRS